MDNRERGSKTGSKSSLLYTIPDSVSLPIGFLASLEGPVIELKPIAQAPQNTAISLKA